MNLAAVAELESGRARGIDDFVLLWVDEGLGAAIVIGGRLYGGATGGAGEIGFLPLPGTPLVRDVRRGNAGAFQELAGGPAVLALARSLGLRATTAPAAVRTALETRAPGTSSSPRSAIGSPSGSRPWSPSSTRPSSCSPAPCAQAGGERLRAAVAEELGSLAAGRGRASSSPSVPEGPVLTGALHTALAAARDDVFDTVRHLASPGSARPVTRRTP